MRGKQSSILLTCDLVSESTIPFAVLGAFHNLISLYFRFIRAPAKNASRYGYIVNKTEITKRGLKTYFSDDNTHSLGFDSATLQDSTSLFQDSASLGGKRKRVSRGEESFELSSSQSWNTGKRLRSSEIRTPVKL